MQRLMDIHVRNVQFVCISACHSEKIGRVFAACGVPHVIAVDWQERISDVASKELSRTLYKNLLQGQTVRQAFESAKVWRSQSSFLFMRLVTLKSTDLFGAGFGVLRWSSQRRRSQICSAA